MPYTKYHDPWGTGAGGATPIVAAALDWIEAGIATAQADAEAAAADVAALDVAAGTVLGYASTQAYQLIGETTTDFTNQSVTVTVAAGRLLRIDAMGTWDAVAAAVGPVVLIREGTTVLSIWRGWSSYYNSVSEQPTYNLFAIVAPTAGSHTYKVSGSSSPVSSPLYITVARTIVVTDCGPA